MTWMAFAFLSAIFAALTTIFAKIGLSKVDSLVATTVRVIIMTVFFLVVVMVRKVDLSPAFHKTEFWFIAASGVAGALSWLFYFMALKSGSATTVAVIDKLSVVIIAILSVLLLKDSLTTRGWFGLGLVVFGTAMMVLK